MEYGLIGEKLGHSFSKDIHNLIDNYDYQLKEIPKEELDAFMKAKDFKGINVTIPYKQDVIPYLDYIDPKAQEIGAVNTIVNQGGKLSGYNTDFFGLKNLILFNKISLKNKKVLILGTGGTSKTAFSVAKDLGAKEILKVSRTKSETTIDYEMAKTIHNDAKIIINTTPVGMFPNTNCSPIDLNCFTKLEGVIDAIYNPLSSKLIVDAKKRGLKASGGLFMLVLQAIAASEFFFNTKIQEDKSLSIFKTLISSKQNIVLVGMPGCGKSTVGTTLSKDLNKDFFDTDILIEQKEGRKPEQIIKENGIDYFRDVESSVIEEISSKQNIILATGGGAILRQKNVDFLKQNGVLIFLDRKIKNIKPTDNRPLSNSMDKLKALYKERYPLYKECADIILENDRSLEEILNKIKQILNDIPGGK